MIGESHSGDMETCGVVDSVLYIQGPTQALVIIHHPHISTASLGEGWGGLDGCIGLPALQPVPCLYGSCMGRGGHGHLVYKYTWSKGNCVT